MDLFKKFLVVLNGIHLVLFFVGFYFCIMALIRPDSPEGLEPEDFWGVIILGSISILLVFLTFINMMKMLGYFSKRSPSLIYSNFGFSGLFFLVGIAGLLGTGVIDREMLVGFLPSFVFLSSGYLFLLPSRQR
jgi:hypothetical protein